MFDFRGTKKTTKPDKLDIKPEKELQPTSKEKSPPVMFYTIKKDIPHVALNKGISPFELLPNERKIDENKDFIYFLHNNQPRIFQKETGLEFCELRNLDTNFLQAVELVQKLGESWRLPLSDEVGKLHDCPYLKNAFGWIWCGDKPRKDKTAVDIFLPRGLVDEGYIYFNEDCRAMAVRDRRISIFEKSQALTEHLSIPQSVKELEKKVITQLSPSETLVKVDVEKNTAWIRRENQDIILDLKRQIELIATGNRDTSFVNAKDWVKDLNAKTGKDWTLPSPDDLTSMISSIRQLPAIPENAWIWSGKSEGNTAWDLSLSSGNVMDGYIHFNANCRSVAMRRRENVKQAEDLTTYTASDRRVYNGAPCSDMNKEWKHTADLEKRMKKADPTAACTYFPAEGKYLVFVNSNLMKNPNLIGPPKILTNNFHSNKQEALIEAITILEQNQTTDQP
jgi:hypothetical protein